MEVGSTEKNTCCKGPHGTGPGGKKKLKGKCQGQFLTKTVPRGSSMSCASRSEGNRAHLGSHSVIIFSRDESKDSGTESCELQIGGGFSGGTGKESKL